MKIVCTLVWMILAVAAVALAQGYSSQPDDASVLEIGRNGLPYEDALPGKAGGRLHVAVLEDPHSWNPITDDAPGTQWFTNRMHRGLMTRHAVTGALESDLAKSFEIGEDGLTITFYLREGICWSDGEPIVADDVVFTYNDLVFNEDVMCNARDVLELPDGTFPIVTAVDDYTVAFEMSTIFRPILSALTLPIVPKHELEQAVHRLNPDVYAGTFNNAWSLDTAPGELVGCGPWIVSDYQPNVSVTMQRNPYYYVYDSAGTQLPYYDAIIASIVSNQDVAMLRFRNGEIDLYALRPEDIPILLPEGAASGFTVEIRDDPTYEMTWLMINQDIGLNDVQVAAKRELYRSTPFREALAHLVDADTMVQNVLNGLGIPAWSPVSMLSPFYAGREWYGGEVTESNAVCFGYDPGLAASKLDERGVVDWDGDGWRDLPGGEPLAIELNTNDDTIRIAYGLILQDDMRSVGLNTTFQVVDANTLSTRMLEASGDLVIFGSDGTGEPNDLRTRHASCGGLHSHRYSARDDPDEIDLRIDELFIMGAGTFDSDEAFYYYEELQILAAQQLGLIFLPQQMFLYACYDRVGNAILPQVVFTPTGIDGLMMETCYDTRL